MSSNIRVPVMPAPARVEHRRHIGDVHYWDKEQLAALNAEWLGNVGPVVEALEAMLKGTEPDCGIMRMPSKEAMQKGFAALSAITKG